MSGGTFGTNWLDLSSSGSNLFTRTYVQGFVDISGGNVILRNNNLYLTGGDSSLNGRLLVGGDASLNSRLFVGSDASFGGRIFATGDVSLNNRLFVGSDSSFGGRIFATGDVSLNNRLFVGSDASFGGRIFATGDVSLNNRLFVGSDVSFGGRIFATGDVSLNNRLYVAWDVSLGDNLFVVGDVSFNSRFYVGSDVSMGGRLFTVGDTSHNARLYVGSDVSLGGRLFLTNDASLNGNVSLAKDLTIGGNLYVNNYTTRQTITAINYQLIVAEDISSSGRLFLAGDASLNSRIYVASDASFGGRIFAVGDTSLNQRLYVGGDVSMGGRLFTIGDTSHNARLYVGSDASFGGRIFAVGDVSLNSRLNVGSDASFGGRLFLNSNSLYVNGVIFTGGSNNFTADVSMNSRLYVGSDVSMGGNLNVSKVLKATSISEAFVTNATTASSYTFDYTAGSVFYITSPPTTNFTCNFTNVPADINRNYVVTVIINSSTNKVFCNSVQINSNTAFAPSFANGTPAAVTFGTLITQSFAIQRVTAGDLSTNVNLLSSITPYTTTTAGYTVLTSNADASLNYRLFVGSDASMGGKLFVVGDTSLNARLFVGSDISLGGRLFVVGDASLNQRLFLTGDASMNSRLFVGSDISLGGRLFVVGDASFNNRLFLSGDASMNSRLFVGSDVSMGGKLFTVGDTSHNARLFVGSDASFGGRIYAVGDVSLNSRLNVGSDASFGGRLYLNSNSLFVNGVLFTGGSNNFTADVSMNYRLFVGSDASFGGRMFTVGDINTTSTSVCNSLFVTADSFFNGTMVLRSGASTMVVTPNTSNANATSWANNNITWTATASSAFPTPATYYPYQAFNNNLGTAGTVGWVSANNYSTAVGATYTGVSTTVTGALVAGSNIVYGDWLQLQSSTPVFMTSYNLASLFAAVSMPKSYCIVGSRDAVNWFPIQYSSTTSTNTLFVNTVYIGTFNINEQTSQNGYTTTNYFPFNSTAYNYFRLIIISVFNSPTTNTYTVIGKWNINFTKSAPYITTDASAINQLDVSGSLSVSNNVGIATTNPLYGLDVSGTGRFTNDLSLNGNVVIGLLTTNLGDISANSRLFVGSDVSFGGRLFLTNDASLNGNVSLAKDLTIGGNLYVNNYTTKQTVTSINYQLILAEDLSSSGRLFLVGDASFNNRLYVGADVSMGGKLFTVGDTSHNARLYVGSDASFGGRIYAVGDVSLNSRLNVGSDASFGGRLYLNSNSLFVNGVLFTGGSNNFTADVSMNSRLYVGSDVSLGGRIYVVGDASFNRRLYVGGDVSFGGNLSTGPVLKFNTGGSITNTTGPQVNPALLVYSNYSQISFPRNDNWITTDFTGQYLFNGLALSTNYGLTYTIPSVLASVGGYDSWVTPNGRVMIAICYQVAYISKDYGATWTTLVNSTNQTWYANTRIVCDNTATYFYAMGNGQTFYMSTNGGTTWTNTFTITGAYAGTTFGFPARVDLCYCNSTGQYAVVAGLYYYGNPCSAFMTNNYGASWTSTTVTSQSCNTDPWMSENGKYIWIGGYLSSDYGATFTVSPALTGLSEGYASNTKSQFAASAYAEIMIMYGSRYDAWLKYSTDQGTTWTQVNGFPGGNGNLAVRNNVISGNGAYNYMSKNVTDTSLNRASITSLVSSGFSLTGNTITTGMSTVATDLSMGGRLILAGDASLNSRLFLGSDISVGGRIFANGDVSMNSRLYVGSDVSMGGKLFTVGDTSHNARLYVGSDVSMGGKLFTVGDTSHNARLYVGSDVSMGGKLFTVGDTSHNARLFVGSDASFGGRIYAVGDVSLNSRLNVGSDASFGGRLYLNSNSLFVNGSLFTGGSNFFTSDVSMNANAYVGKSLNIGVSGNLYPFDISGTVNIRGAVNPLTLIDGSVLLSNTLPLDFSNNFAVTYKQITIGGGGYQIAMSTTGQYQYASFGAAYIYASYNYGATWFQVTTPGNINGIGTSGNGKYVTGGQAGSGGLFKSSNYGITWTTDAAVTNNTITSVVISATGQYQMVSWDGYNRTYVSSDYGNSWGGGSTMNQARSLAISATGQYQAGTNNNGAAGAYNYSSNFGASFAAASITGTFIAMSSTGQYQAIYATTGYINVSTNFGATWTQVGTSQSFTSISISSSGQFMVACTSTGYIFTSANFGTTWLQTLSTGLNLNSISMSGNAQYITAITTGGVLLVFTTPYSNLAISNGSVLMGDVSMNSRLYVGSDVSMGGRLFLTNDASFNGNIFIGSNLTSATSILIGSTPATITPNITSVTSASWTNAGVTWTVTSSSNYVPNGFNNYLAFNSGTSLGWYDNTGSYSGASGAYVGTTYSTVIQNSVGTVYGEWLQIQSSIPISMTSWILGGAQYYGGDTPQSFYICGSTDNSTWYPLIYGAWTSSPITGTTFTASYSIPPGTASNVVNGPLTYTTYGNGGKTYTYFRLVVTSIIDGLYGLSANNTNHVNTQWRLGFISPITGLAVTTGDASLNNRLYVGSDASFGGRLFLTNDASFNGRLYLNSNSLFVNGALFSGGSSYFAGDASVNVRLFVGSDVSMGGRLFTVSDASLNSRLFVGSDVSLGGRLFTVGDASLNSRLFVGSDVSVNGNLSVTKLFKPNTISEAFVTNSTTASSYTFDYSTGGIFYITAPPSTNFTCNFTNVPADINRNYVITVIINSTTNKTFCNSVQINSNTAISPVFANGMPTSMNFGSLMTQSIAIQRVTAGDLTANVNVIASLTPYSSASTGNYLIASAADASLSYRLYVGSDVSMGGRLYVAGTTGIGTATPGSALSFGTTTNNKILTLFDQGATDAVSTATNFYGFGVNTSTLRYQVPTGGNHLWYINATNVLTVDTGGNLLAKSGSTSTSTTTGALQVTGGAGITGNAYIGGNVQAGPNSASLVYLASGEVKLVGSGFAHYSIYNKSGVLSIQNTSNNIATGTDGTAYMNFNSVGRVELPVNIASTTTSTGTLVVGGGAGFTGNVYVGGNVVVSSSFKPTIITEPFATNAGTTSPYTFDYSTGPTFYVTTPPASNFTCNFTNVPADINRTYVATIVIKTSSNRTFCNTVQINSNGTTFTPYFANGIPTSIATASMITQTISIQRLVASDAGPNGTNSNVLSAVIAYY